MCTEVQLFLAQPAAKMHVASRPSSGPSGQPQLLHGLRSLCVHDRCVLAPLTLSPRHTIVCSVVFSLLLCGGVL